MTFVRWQERRKSILRGLFLLAFVSILPSEGRKCICTSKACKEAGVDTCRTKYSCYTELILAADQELKEDAVTRGCTEGATPLLCETKSWVTRSKSALRMSWPRLKCCDSHDYCNGDRRMNVSAWTREAEERMTTNPPSLSPSPSAELAPSTIEREESALHNDDDDGEVPKEIEESVERKTFEQRVRDRVRPLHMAALVLAIAALISVFAAYYVVTRFLKSHPYRISVVEQ